jgi:hypothetical protein
MSENFPDLPLDDKKLSEESDLPDISSEAQSKELTPGQDVTLFHKGKEQAGWIIDEQDNLYPGMVKIKRKDGSMEGRYAFPDMLSEAQSTPSPEEFKRDEVAEEAGEIAIEQVVEPIKTNEDKVKEKRENISFDEQVEVPEKKQPERPKSNKKEKTRKKPEAAETSYKFKPGQKVLVRSRDGKSKHEREVVKSFVGKENKKIVVVRDPSGKYPDAYPPEESVEAIIIQKEDKQAPQNDLPPVEKKDPYSENSWLDPRRIQELKPQFDLLVEKKVEEIKNRGLWPEDSSEEKHLENIINTAALEHLVKTQLKSTNTRVQGIGEDGKASVTGWKNNHPNYKYNVPGLKDNFSNTEFSILEMPAEHTKEQMLAMLKKSEQNIGAKAKEKENEVLAPTFTAGDKVKIIHHDNSISEAVVDKLVKGGVWVNDEGGKKLFTETQLKEFQERANPNKEKDNINKLKPYFNKPAKVKLPGGEVIEGRVGYSTTKHKAYVSGPNGDWLPDLVEVDEFLSWQNQETETEKIDGADSEIPDSLKKFELGHEVKVIHNNVLESGWVVDDFKKNGEKIMVQIKKGNVRGELEQELLKNWQLAPDNYTPSIESDASDNVPDAAEEPADAPTEEIDTTSDEDSQESQSWLDSITAKNRQYWKQFEGGDTEKERKQNKRKKRVRGAAAFAGTAALLPWAVTSFPLYGPVLFGQRSLHRRRMKKQGHGSDH